MYYLIVREFCSNDYVHHGKILMSSFNLDFILSEYLAKYVVLNVNKYPIEEEYNYWLLEMPKNYYDNIMNDYKNQLLYINKFMKSGCMKLYLNEKSIKMKCKYNYFFEKLTRKSFFEKLIEGLEKIYKIPNKEIGKTFELEKTKFLKRYKKSQIIKKKQDLCLLLQNCIENDHHLNFNKVNGDKIELYKTKN